MLKGSFWPVGNQLLSLPIPYAITLQTVSSPSNPAEPTVMTRGLIRIDQAFVEDLVSLGKLNAFAFLFFCLFAYNILLHSMRAAIPCSSLTRTPQESPKQGWPHSAASSMVQTCFYFFLNASIMPSSICPKFITIAKHI